MAVKRVKVLCSGGCGKPVMGHVGSLGMCVECRRKAHTFTCRECGGSFHRSDSLRRAHLYCTRECYEAARQRTKAVCTCPWCGGERRSHCECCSRACAAYYARWKRTGWTVSLVKALAAV